MASLNVKQVEALVRAGKPGRYACGSGLYLQLDPQRASWLYRFQMNGKARSMGLGAHPEVSLAQARQAAEEARRQMRQGIDPLEARKAARAPVSRPVVPSFKAAAEDFVAAREAGWKNEKHAAQWTATLAAYAFPLIGAKPVDAVSTDDVLAILRPIWTEKPETATRVRGRIEAVLDAAKVRGWRQGENPARWKGHLALLLPTRAKVAEVRHHPALDWRLVPALLPALATKEGAAARALRFAILTAMRSGEVRGATWGEIKIGERLWVVPASRMKGGREHRVPLSDAALAVLHEAAATRSLAPADLPPEDLVFPARGGSALSDMALTVLLRKLKRPDGSGWTDQSGATITAHGFRSSFRDWAGEATHHPREVIEHALAHRLKDKAEAAYARGDLLAKRAALMADWGSFCTSSQADVVQLPRRVPA